MLHNPSKIARAAPIVIALLLSACASNDKPRAVARVPVQTGQVRSSAAPAPTGRTSTAVWQLRSGLNVAALSCRGRGRAPVAGEYGKMLSRHRTLLAAAYKEEERRLGRAGFDRQQTRAYNRFANQRSPEKFCQTASELARSANRMDSADLAPAARGMVAELESRLR